MRCAQVCVSLLGRYVKIQHLVNVNELRLIDMPLKSRTLVLLGVATVGIWEAHRELFFWRGMARSGLNL